MEIQDDMNHYMESSEWETVHLGDVVKNVQINEYHPLESGLTRYVAGEHMESEQTWVRKWGDIEEDQDVIGSAFHRKFVKGQVLFGTRRTYLRKAGISTFDGICANTTLVLESDGIRLPDRLFPFILQSDRFVEYSIEISVGSTNPFVKWKDLANYQFLLPRQLSLKKRIADVLWGIEDLISSNEALLEKTISLKKALLNHFMIKGTNHGKFKAIKTDFGKTLKIPIEWDYDRIGKHYDFTTKPKHFKYDDLEEIPFVPMEKIPIDRIFLETYDMRKSSEIASGTYFERGDLLLAKITPSFEHGKQCIAEIPHEFGIATTEVIPIKDREKESDKFYLFYFLLRDDVRTFLKGKMEGGTGRQRISKDIVESLHIPFPKYSEQIEISKRIRMVVDQIIALQNHGAKLHQLKKKLLNSLLNREIVLKGDRADVQ